MSDNKTEDLLLEMIKELQIQLNEQSSKRESDTKSLAAANERLLERSEITKRDIEKLSRQLSEYNGKIAHAIEQSRLIQEKRFNAIEAESKERIKSCHKHFEQLDMITNPPYSIVAEKKSKTVGIAIAAIGMSIGLFKFIFDTITVAIKYFRGN